MVWVEGYDARGYNFDTCTWAEVDRLIASFKNDGWPSCVVYGVDSTGYRDSDDILYSVDF